MSNWAILSHHRALSSIFHYSRMPYGRLDFQHYLASSLLYQYAMDYRFCVHDDGNKMDFITTLVQEWLRRDCVHTNFKILQIELKYLTRGQGNKMYVIPVAVEEFFKQQSGGRQDRGAGSRSMASGRTRGDRTPTRWRAAGSWSMAARMGTAVQVATSTN
jgi:hypothetical protein